MGDVPNHEEEESMRGKADRVLLSLGLGTHRPFICFARPDNNQTRTFYSVTAKQIDRVAEVVERMAAKDELEIYLHRWGWAGCREGLS